MSARMRAIAGQQTLNLFMSLCTNSPLHKDTQYKATLVVRTRQMGTDDCTLTVEVPLSKDNLVSEHVFLIAKINSQDREAVSDFAFTHNITSIQSKIVEACDAPLPRVATYNQHLQLYNNFTECQQTCEVLTVLQMHSGFWIATSKADTPKQNLSHVQMIMIIAVDHCSQKPRAHFMEAVAETSTSNSRL